MKILVTGSAGFVGYTLSERLLAEGNKVVGLDNMNDYYEVSLKEARNSRLIKNENYRFFQYNLTDMPKLLELFEKEKFDYVVNLAAQAGVRYSITNPYAYLESNLTGFLNILEACRKYPPKHLLYASSSSVYGLNSKIPFSVNSNVDHPISLYAATKKSNELMAHTYAHLYKLPVTGLRFFTVYGPWGRPDMAYFKFAKAIIQNESIDVYNNGNMERDFTYIDDIVEGIMRLIPLVPTGDPSWNSADPDPSRSIAPYRVYNIGNNNPVKLMDFIHILESELGKKAVCNFKPMQPGDVLATYADIDDLVNETGYRPRVKIEEGLAKFVVWFKEYYAV